MEKEKKIIGFKALKRKDLNERCREAHIAEFSKGLRENCSSVELVTNEFGNVVGIMLKTGGIKPYPEYLDDYKIEVEEFLKEVEDEDPYPAINNIVFFRPGAVHVYFQ